MDIDTLNIIDEWILAISIVWLIYTGFRTNCIFKSRFKKPLLCMIDSMLILIAVEIFIYKIHPQIAIITLLVGYMFIMIGLYKNRLREKLFYISFLYFLIFTINAFVLSVTIVACTFDDNLERFIYGHCRLIQLSMFMIIYIAIEINLFKFWKSEYLFNFVKNTKRDWLFNLGYLVVIVVSILGILSIRRLDLGRILICFYYYIIILLFIFMILLIFKINMDTVKFSIFNSSKKLEVKYLNENIKILDTREKKKNILYHDMKHHIFAIKYLVDNGELERAQNYIKSLEIEFHEVDSKKLTGNILVNGIVLEKIRLASELEINHNFKVLAKENIKINDADLASLLSNVIDNAIEGAERADAKDKFIDVDLVIDNKALTLKVKNSSNSNIDLNTTSKKDKNQHGFGSKSIVRIVNIYDGDIKIQNKNNIFSVVIYIPF